MKNILILTLLFTSVSFATDTSNDKKVRAQKQLKIEMEREKKFAREQTFYQGANYDFKGSEINEESLKSMKEIEVDELDMDSVYD